MTAFYFKFLTIFLAASSCVVGGVTTAQHHNGTVEFLQERAPDVDFVDPRPGGGTFLTDTGNGLGEPLNVIISAKSSPGVLSNLGLVNYARSIGFSIECLGLHLGDPQKANLGDGRGPFNQTMLLRMNYGLLLIGTCLESLIGGNHFRVFRQDGPSANTGALFLAVSQEEDLSEHHTISPNGYDVGRDLLVATATRRRTSFLGVTYETTVQDVTGLLPAGAEGINHGIGTDGVVKVLTVKIV